MSLTRPGPSAEVTALPEPYARRVLSTWRLIVGTLLCFVPVLGMFGGMGLVAAALWFWVGDDGPGAGPPAELVPALAVLVVVGVALAAFSAWLGMRSPTWLPNYWLRGVARRAVRERPDALVDPDDPEVWFVEVVPRENWGRLMLETATDCGFLKVDELKGEVLFEGDRERYRVPAAAVVGCDVEEAVFGEGTSGAVRYFFTVLRARRGAAEWEAPLAKRGDFGALGAEVRRRRARELLEKILGLVRDRVS